MTTVCACSMRVVSPHVRVWTSSTATVARLTQGGPVTRRIVCSAESSASEGGGHSDPPKLEPFSQSRLTRAMRERSFLQKAEDALNDKCLALDGEAAYQCWEALFEYENIKEEAETECTVAEPDERQDACQPLERLENMVRHSGGVNSLIDNVLMAARIKELKKKTTPPTEESWLKAVSELGSEELKPSDRADFLEDGGIPKTEKELQEAMEALMPDSPFTRVLKRRGFKGLGNE